MFAVASVPAQFEQNPRLCSADCTTAASYHERQLNHEDATVATHAQPLCTAPTALALWRAAFDQTLRPASTTLPACT